MSATTVYVSAPLREERGGTVLLHLLLTSANAQTEIRVDREQRLPHKTLTSTAVRITEPSARIEPVARAMTTVVHELERLHAQGYSLRERSVGWRGTWHTDLLSPSGAGVAMSWKIDLTKHSAELLRLADRLAAHDPPVASFDQPDDTATLAAMMRHQGAEARREHAIDALIAEDATLSAAELVDEMHRRGLLAPPQDDSE